ncbi:cupin domain-containing protein [Intrasporangium calvum]|uniref:Cupin 4 family protein n=1 Tax=Intrasporangium calvum (strain ATCC 23552 / DSM 43043 / JCM 3097 / NBRC 12989 / NCIMB 10167 / NRRL B-3866 / 7 KIP) TaxID=710696 RepID=E6S8T4_INTC7|nr:cupin domain-containing protein [Intrasporangium calvum]ADU47053.1 cupin 4 family protein [Intrasporangium calvum DSM 43043]
MSLTTQSRGSAPTRRPSALPRLVSVPVDEFASDHWGRQPLVSLGADLAGGFEDLFSLEAVDELVSRRGLRTPFVRVAKNGQTLPDSAFTAGGGVGAGIADQVSDDKLLRLFADGATIVLQGLHRTWAPVSDFVAALAEDLGHPVQANAYVTPRQSQGFNDHYDVHDVFVLQVAGEKHWRIRLPVHLWPTRDQPWTAYRERVGQAAAEPPLLDVTLRAGDCLYLPRGFLHSATATEEVSAHLTLGVHTWTRAHLAEALVAEAMHALVDAESERAPLPLGVDVGNPAGVADEVTRLREVLAGLVEGIDPDRVAARLGRQARAAARPGPLSPVAQARRALQLGPDDVIRLRGFVRPEVIDGPDGGAVVQSRAGSLTVTADERPAIETLLAQGEAPVSTLGLDLARRLLTAGLAL